MPVKQKNLEERKQHEVDQQVIDALSQIDLGSMSLMSLLHPQKLRELFNANNPSEFPTKPTNTGTPEVPV